MTTLQLRPLSIPVTVLAAYGYPDPDRETVIKNLLARLDDDGKLGHIARFYIVSKRYRLETLRRILRTLDLPLPPWLNRDRATAQANEQFIEATQETYHAWRNSQSNKARNTRINQQKAN